MKRVSSSSSSRSFSSTSLGGYSTGAHYTPITPVSVNKSLLTPLNTTIDPRIQVIRTKEKDDIKTLNNRFASFIDKVRFLEQQNKMLETKWSVMQTQSSSGRSSIEPMFEAYLSNLRRQLDLANNERVKLDAELKNMQCVVEESKDKYEKEIYQRNSRESDFVLLKKDVDSAYLIKVELEQKVANLADEISFLRVVYDEEIRELQNSIKDTSVTVQMDNSRDLNMDHIVAEVKAQYAEIATRSRQEIEIWYQNKLDQASLQAKVSEDELRSIKSEILEVTRLISRLHQEIDNAKIQVTTLSGQISEVEARGERAMKDADGKIRDLERALLKAKQLMAQQVRDYQELMNIKLALDIEIATYRKLLEGEEDRIADCGRPAVQTVSPSVKPILIKMMETQDQFR